MPSGTSIARIIPVNINWRPSASWKRSERSTCSNQVVPSQKKTLSPKVSCIE